MITITIDTDIDSFQNGNEGKELKRIFESIIDKSQRSDVFGITDENGYIIGQYNRD